ncbi:hypothetical protein [Enterobacter huaxiensis]|uniref:hypothetical protein n=1 Tax=Enterobacter huaxiensis TaxID=2494702 RepID=UPI0021D939AF|nr:hypothetical protein [Enterobacter huaxiensis]
MAMIVTGESSNHRLTEKDKPYIPALQGRLSGQFLYCNAVPYSLPLTEPAADEECINRKIKNDMNSELIFTSPALMNGGLLCNVKRCLFQLIQMTPF